MKVLHTADWHIGEFKGPVKDGINLRTEDTKNCLNELVRVAREEMPDYSLISGDVFDVGKLWSDRCCDEIITAYRYIRELAEVSKQVIVMRGTPNHDGEGQFNVLSKMFADYKNVYIVTVPQVISFDEVDIAVFPGFEKGVYRTKVPGLSAEDENEKLTKEISNIVTGLKAQCSPNKKSILMAHYTVPGCNTESGQKMMLTQFEPIIPQEALFAANYDLVALGHIHRPQKILSQDWYYSGAVNAITFNDEGQDTYDIDAEGNVNAFFHNTPIREFITLNFSDVDITAINMGNIDDVAYKYWRCSGALKDKIVRVHYSCTAENDKALNKALLRKILIDDGAFMVKEILADNIGETANKTELADTTDPETNLIQYLKEKQVPEEKIQELVIKSRPIIAEAEASMTSAVNTGIFEPIEIAVKNYRNYEEETFNFEDITFCTINGQNGAGKSSLFMDAIIDCLFEEPREGKITDDEGKSPWLRNDEKVHSGSIMFTFRIGEKKYRVTRTRSRSGSGRLNISQFINGDWVNCSKEKSRDTQQEILNILGMDSFTFKSCALIMQDQYGLFLQAKSEDRVEVLGTLLGLGIYQSMEKIAADNAKTYGTKMRDLKHEIEIHSSTIAGFENPEDELAYCSSQLTEYETRLQAKTAERDKNKLLLTHLQEAENRRNRILENVAELEVRKQKREQDIEVEKIKYAGSVEILSHRDEIEGMASQYNSMVERERTLSAEAALYLSKKAEAEDVARQVKAEELQLESLNMERRTEESKKSALEAPVDEDAIRNAAVEYEKYSELLNKMKDLNAKYAEALSEKERKPMQ